MEQEKEKYMYLAMELAEKGRGRTSPNPVVGAVVVKNRKIIGQGFHERYGGLHAERNALADCKENTEGADLYVTLEPCCHYGKTPPCTEAILQYKIARVFVGSMDPNPLVAGKGIAVLRKNGVSVETGVCKKECDRQNKIFFHYIITKTPYVVMKYAMTADGKIATHTGHSQWITGDEARERVQQERNALSAIMVGIGTVLADDPLLTCRISGGRNPVRIVCDSHLRIPLDSKLVQTAQESTVLVAAAVIDEEKRKALQKAGVEVLHAADSKGKVDLKILMQMLGQRNIDSILLEGGGTLNYSALQEGIVQRCEVYLSPKIFGGKNAKTPVEGYGIKMAGDSFHLIMDKISVIGRDLLIEYDVQKEGE